MKFLLWIASLVLNSNRDSMFHHLDCFSCSNVVTPTFLHFTQKLPKFNNLVIWASIHWQHLVLISDHTRLGHWILDGDSAHSHLLRFALTESNFTETTVLLCVAMTTPWNIMDQLQNWASILQDHIDRLNLSAEKTKQLQNESESWSVCCRSIVMLRSSKLTRLVLVAQVQPQQSHLESVWREQGVSFSSLSFLSPSGVPKINLVNSSEGEHLEYFSVKVIVLLGRVLR